MTEESKNRQLTIEWKTPDSIFSRYATNIVVQKTEHEFVLSFFELHPPLILGELPPDMDTVPAECVARIIVSAQKMPEFIAVLNEHLRRLNEAAKEEVQ